MNLCNKECEFQHDGLCYRNKTRSYTDLVSDCPLSVKGSKDSTNGFGKISYRNDLRHTE